MKLSFTKVLALLLLLVQHLPSFSQRVINAANTPDVANFNGWVNTPNPITGYVFSNTTNRVGTTVATTGGLYAIANRGLGYRPSSSASAFTLTGTYRNNTGAAIAVGDTIQVSYRAEVIDANSRIPGWDVTVAGQTNSSFDWLSTNGTQTKTQKFVRTTAIANNTNFTLVFSSDRGTGSGSSPLIGINDITVTILPATVSCPTPSVTTQPADLSVFAPNTATFSVAAANVTSYQWQWRATASGNWANVTTTEGTGGNTASFTTVPTTQSMNGYQYRVVLNNTCGSTTMTLNSNAATLTVNCNNPVVTMQPSDTTVMSGVPAGFSIDATAATGYQWQWRANSTAAWADVTAAEGNGGTTDSFTTIATTAQMNGYQYRVMVTNACGTTLTDSAILNICMPPVVTMQPSGTTVTAGNVGIFEVEAGNVSTYQWQWRANSAAAWANVTAAEGTGGTTDSFTTIATTAQMNGYQYRVVLTGICGGTLTSTVITDSAILNICMPPVVTTQPTHTTVTLGNVAVFQVAANNVTAYQWQWRANGTATWTNVTAAEGTGGTTNAFTTIAATQQMNGYQYRVIVTNACGGTLSSTVFTDSAILNICMPPVVTTQPAHTTVTLGNVAVFQVAANNVTAYQWQWRANSTGAWTNVTAAEGTGGTSNAFTTIAATQQMNGYQYRVIVTNACGGTLSSTVFTDSAILNICMPPVVTAQPAHTTVTLGNVAVFQVAANNVTAYQWQWRANSAAAWTNVTAAEGTGGTSNAFTTIAATQQMNGYQYRVILTNACGGTLSSTVITDSATLTICMPPTITTQVVNTTVVAGTSAVFEVEAGNATSYQWQWRANNTANWFDATIAEGTGATTDSFTTIATTMAMTGYQYRVRVTNACGAGTIANLISDTGVLTVVCPPAAAITVQPVNVAINLGANALFTVHATGAASYQWQTWDVLTSAWLNIAPGTSGYTGQTTDSLIIIAPGLAMDNSKYRVVLTNLCATTTTSGEAMLTIDAGIAVHTNPVSVLNTNGFTSVTTFTNTGIGQHQTEGIRYSTDGITWNPLVAGGVISNLQPNTQYYYQGYATFNLGTFYGAVLDTFTLANVAGTTTLNALAGGTTIDLTLNPNNNPAYTQYAIASGTRWVQANGTLGTTAAWLNAADWNALTISELTPNTDYCFKVKAKNSDGIETALNTEACMRTTGNVSVKDIAAALNSQVAIYPNPSSTGIVQLKYDFVSPVDLKVSVTDLSGKVVFATDMKALRTGQQTLDLSKLAQGMYFIKLSADGASAGKKLIIAK